MLRFNVVVIAFDSHRWIFFSYTRKVRWSTLDTTQATVLTVASAQRKCMWHVVMPPHRPNAGDGAMSTMKGYGIMTHWTPSRSLLSLIWIFRFVMCTSFQWRVTDLWYSKCTHFCLPLFCADANQDEHWNATLLLVIVIVNRAIGSLCDSVITQISLDGSLVVMIQLMVRSAFSIFS